MAQTHSLCVALAVEYGTNEALFLTNICWWLEKNIANGRHYYDGRWWTYNSTKAFCEIMPYFTERNIRTIIDNLKQRGALITGNYNRHGYDKTTWYSVSGKAFLLYAKGICECPLFDFLENSTNGIPENANSPMYQNREMHVSEKSHGHD